MKRIFAVLLSVVMVIPCVFAVSADEPEYDKNLPIEEKMKYEEAYEYEENGITYEYQNVDNLAVVIGVSSATETEITLPTEINGKEVLFWAGSFTGAAFESVTVPKGTEKLDCFLVSPTMRESVKYVNLPEGLKTLGEGSLSSLYNLEEITLPESLINIGDYAFAYCRKLKSIKIPNSVEWIGERAFEECVNLNSVTFPKDLEYIGKNAFNKTNMRSITLPANIEFIGQFALHITDLEEVIFKGAPKEINKLAFPGTIKEVKGLTEEQLMKIWASLINTKFAQNYTTDNPEHEFIVNDGVLEGYIGTETEIVIPDGVRTIGTNVFNNKSITSVVIPASVEEIKSSFGDCKKLKSVTFEPSNHSVAINEFAFRGCDALTELNLPDNVKINQSLIVVNNGEDPIPTPGLLLPEQLTGMPAPEPASSPVPSSSPAPQVLEVSNDGEVKVSVDGKAVEFDAKPFIDGNDRTQVPIRAVSEMLNCKVDWDGETRTVTISQDSEKTVEIVIGSDIMRVNEKEVKMDTKAMIKDDRTYIPVRFVAEALGLTVEWAE